MSADIKQNIRSLSKVELTEHLKTQNIPKFRADQVYHWLWQKNVSSFTEMANLGKPLTEWLETNYFIDRVHVSDVQISKDKTIKCAFKVEETKIVEGVLIPTASRMTACISSQIGCSLACTFCATGKLKLLRNLSPGEIVDQVVELKKLALEKYDITLSNVVLMGMGEPLLNYQNVIQAIDIITDPNGLGMSPRRITLSTAGISKMIKRLGDEEVRFNLALSLHAANDLKRGEMMEINHSNNLESLSEALQYFHERTGTRVTFEYIIFKDFNDSIEDAVELANFAKCVPCKINIIEYNSIDDGIFTKASEERTADFASFLENKNLIVNVRRSRGKDIDAACGQLANKNQSAANHVIKKS